MTVCYPLGHSGRFFCYCNKIFTESWIYPFFYFSALQDVLHLLLFCFNYFLFFVLHRDNLWLLLVCVALAAFSLGPYVNSFQVISSAAV